MAGALSAQQWEEIFHKYDKDNSGSLDMKELKDLLLSNNCNLSDSQIADVFVFLAGPKVTKDSRITKDEFISGILRIQALIEAIQGLFKKYDSDNNGYLSPAELKNLLRECDKEKTLTEQTMDEIIKAADINKDGKVSMDEFINALS